MPTPPLNRRTLLATIGLAGAAVGTRVATARQPSTPAATLNASPAASPEASPVAGQVVAVELGDYYVKPATTTFAVDAPYTFRVTNRSAQQVHEFVLERAGAHDAPLENAAGEESEIEDIGPGTTREMTWTFTDAGAYQLACYVANHAELGMVTEITVKN
jgi:uncharacterized cupredoxin-like copper-binding protein